VTIHDSAPTPSKCLVRDTALRTMSTARDTTHPGLPGRGQIGVGIPIDSAEEVVDRHRHGGGSVGSKELRTRRGPERRVRL
jgi:hypothetical protein